MENSKMPYPLSLARQDLLNGFCFQSAHACDLLDKTRLHANENPYPLRNKRLLQCFFDKDEFTANRFDSINRYPENQPKDLKNRLLSLYGLKNQDLLITRGSDESIDLILRGFCLFELDEIIICPPTFSMYEVYGKLNKVKVVKIPLLENNQYSLDLPAILDRVNSHKSKIIFIPNPNAPLGHFMDPVSILELCKNVGETTLVVVDEAYLEFSDRKSFIEYMDDLPNLIVLRTLSKFFGLAGLRIGSCIANFNIIQFLNHILPPYNLTLPSIQMALVALSDEKLQWRQKKNLQLKIEKEKLNSALNKFDFIKHIYPSETNYVTLKVDNIQYLLKCFADNGILIKDISQQLADTIRISIGTAKENKMLLRVFKQVQMAGN